MLEGSTETAEDSAIIEDVANAEKQQDLLENSDSLASMTDVKVMEKEMYRNIYTKIMLLIIMRKSQDQEILQN